MATERQIGRARELRRNATEAESRLWSRLRSRQLDGAKFVRQHLIGPYVADLCCRGAIEANGYMILGFWNNDVLENTDGVRTVLQTARM